MVLYGKVPFGTTYVDSEYLGDQEFEESTVMIVWKWVSLYFSGGGHLGV